MKNLGSVLILFIIILASCGVDTSNKESSTEKIVSNTAHEDMMGIINDCNIAIPKNLLFVDGIKDSTTYKITFKGEDIDEEAKDLIENWLVEQTDRLSKEYWGKRSISNKNQLLGVQTNEVVLIKPQKSKVKVNNSIKISTSYYYDSQTYTLVFTAD